MKPNRAFTLIEMLLVVSLIALLISLLLPALSSAKGNADRVVCLSNLSQIGNATTQYVLQNGRRFPAKGPSMYSWIGTAGSVYLTNFGADKRAINPYLSGAPFEPNAEVRLAQCPRDTGAEWGDGISSYEAQGSSYGSNTHSGMPSLYNGSSHGVSLSRIPDPSRMVVLGDNPAFASAWWSSSYWSVHSKVPGFFWHDEAFHWNLSFADGHAGFTEVQNTELFGDDYTFRMDF